ncbi:hypothetical protein N9V04_02605 [Bacteroidota bacterium]|nr:hypothetical protein [Bacteroidota bacterium]MDC2982174.1 hypothetical protein [Bacteroidota bacterium]
MKSLLTLIFLGFLVSATSQTDGRHSSRAPNQETTSFQKNENEIDPVVTENGTIESFGSSPVNMRHAKDCLERAEYSFEMKDYYATLVNANCIISRNVLLAEGYSYRGIAKFHLKDVSYCIDLKIGCDYGNTGACEYHNKHCKQNK